MKTWLPIVGLVPILIALGAIVLELGGMRNEFEGMTPAIDRVGSRLESHLEEADSLEARLYRTRVLVCVSNGRPVESCLEGERAIR